MTLSLIAICLVLEILLCLCEEPGGRRLSRAKSKGGNPGQPAVALAIVRSAHNYSLKKQVHGVNFKTNEVRPGSIPVNNKAA
jgi:hypothetical protein